MRRYTFIPVVVVLLALLVAVLPSPVMAQGGTYALTILHTNDTHSRIEQFDSSGTSCDPGETCYGGVARRNYMINTIRKEGGNLLLVDAGDAFQGSLYFNKFQGLAELHFMNHLGYQAMAVGNHEFDLGPGPLGHFARYANFPVLSANLDVSKEPALTGLIQPYTVVTIGGEKIGLIGLTTEEVTVISNIGPTVKVLDPIAAARNAVAALQGQGVNKIVVLSHLGYDMDNLLATSVAGLDVIVGGHSHTLLGTMSGAAGPYPNPLIGPGGEPVLVVQDGEWGKYLGRLNVTFDASGRLTAYSGAPILLDASVPQDSQVLDMINTLFAPGLAELKATVIGQSQVDLDGARANVRSKETNLGNLVCDAMLWATRSDKTQVCITNGGGIRASIKAGNVTMGDVLTVLPFGNTLVDMDLTGAQIIEALENGVSQVESGAGRFPQVGGLRFAYNPSLPAKSRIIKVEVLVGGKYEMLDPNKTYRLVTNNFMATGGDGYSVFTQGKKVYNSGLLMADALADYIKLNSPVNPKVEGRIATSTALLPETGYVLAFSWAFLGAGALLGGGLALRRMARRRAA